MEMYTVQEMIDFLVNHHMTWVSEQMIRRHLREGKIAGIRSSNRKVGWKIPETEILNFMESLRVKGTAYEEGIDDKTKVKRLLEEIEHLENRIGQYAEENHELREQLGLNSF